MKIQNIIVACITIVVLGAAITSCQTTADPAKQAKVVDSLVQVKVDKQIAELNKECRENSMKMAMAMVDSITEANAKKVASTGGKTVKKPVPAAKPPVTTTTTTTTTTKATQPGTLGSGKKGTSKTNSEAKLGEGKKGTSDSDNKARLGKGKKGMSGGGK